jgi:hypothetical protein
VSGPRQKGVELTAKIIIKMHGLNCSDDCPWLDWNDGYNDTSPKCHLFTLRVGDGNRFKATALDDDRSNCRDANDRGVARRMQRCFDSIKGPVT